MTKKNIRKTLIEASGQSFYEDKTCNLGYLTLNGFYNQIADILKEVHFTHNATKGKYIDKDDHLAHMFNWHDIKDKLRNSRKMCDATLNSRFITGAEQQKMLKSLIDIVIYAQLGIELWFDNFGEDL